MAPGRGKPPLLSERERKVRKPLEAGGRWRRGVGGPKPVQGGEGAERPDLDAVLRSGQAGL